MCCYLLSCRYATSPKIVVVTPHVKTCIYVNTSSKTNADKINQIHVNLDIICTLSIIYPFYEKNTWIILIHENSRSGYRRITTGYFGHLVLLRSAPSTTRQVDAAKKTPVSFCISVATISEETVNSVLNAPEVMH